MAIFTATSSLDDAGAGFTLWEALANANVDLDEIVFDASLPVQTIRLTSSALCISCGKFNGDTDGDGVDCPEVKTDDGRSVRAFDCDWRPHRIDWFLGSHDHMQRQSALSRRSARAGQ